MRLITTILSAAVLLAACNRNGNNYDASGTFEATEVIVSSEVPGKILSLNLNEGDTIPADSIVGMVDATNLNLQKEQVEASIHSLGEKTADAGPQVTLLQHQLDVQQSQLSTLLHEKQRIENLLKQDAATGKQLDDINAQIDVVKKQMDVTRQQIRVQQSNVNTQNRGIISEAKPLEKRVAQLNDQLTRSAIVHPVSGTV